MMISTVGIVVGLVALQRLGELALANRNTRNLLAEGAIESGRGHYPLLVLLHTGWLLAILLFVPGDAPVYWLPLALFLILQGLRIWVVATLGRFWTTRIISLPGAPLIRSGPYRFLRHPNYAVVIGEIALLPLAFGAWEIAMVFSGLNLALLYYRIRAEEKALETRLHK